MHRTIAGVIIFVLFAQFLCPSTAHAADSGVNRIAFNSPALPTHAELLDFVSAARPPAMLRVKLDALLTQPFVSTAPLAAPPALSRNDRLGEFIRVGFWNIERGLRLDDIRQAIERPEEFKARIKAEDEASRAEIVEQVELFRSLDVLVLNEVDLGLERTGYRDVARELAAAMRMHHAFGVEFVELDPVHLGAASPAEPVAARAVDPERYRGLHGTAILSRFPIRQARLVPLKTQPYDWFNEERKRLSVAESARRHIGRMTLNTTVPREIRYGGRTVLIAELDVPQVEGGTLTVVATHLENRTGPRARRQQMREVLSLIRDIRGPLVLAGDLNTTGSDMSPTSIQKEMVKRLRSKSFWAKHAVKAATSLGLVMDVGLAVLRYGRTMKDPTAKSILFFAPNHEADLFREIERHRFADGYAFDFRGDPARTVNGTAGTLANSNERSRPKGFASTYATERTFWSVGKSKLDWILVKAYAREPRGAQEPYRMAPHFARTLSAFNEALGGRLSDHRPITVDLPVNEVDL